MRRFVGTPATDAGAVAKAVSRDMIIAHLDDELRFQRLPFGRALGTPAARRARRVAVEAGWRDELFELLCESGFVAIGDGGGKPDMIEPAGIVVETEQQRAHEIGIALIAETADDAICRAHAFHFQHGPLTRAVSLVDAFRDDAVDRTA